LAATGTPVISLTLTDTPGRTSTHSPTQTASPALADLSNKKVLAFPNPAKGTMQFAYRAERSGRIAIHIYNVNGERAAALSADALSGQGIITWHCSNMAPGIYLARLLLEGEEIGRAKVAVVH
jgi:hypothetical protein